MQLFISNNQDGCGVFGVLYVEIVFMVTTFAALLVTAVIVAFAVMLVLLLVVLVVAAAGPRLGEAFLHDPDEQLQYTRSPGDSHRQKPTGLTVAIA